MLLRVVALVALSFILSAAACNPASTSSTSSTTSSGSAADCDAAYRQWKSAYADYEVALQVKKTTPSYDTDYWYKKVLQAKAEYEKVCY